MKKQTSTEIHLSILKLLRDHGILSKVKIKEYLAEHYSNIRQTQNIVIHNLRKSGLVDERTGEDGQKYLIFRRVK